MLEITELWFPQCTYMQSKTLLLESHHAIWSGHLPFRHLLCQTLSPATAECTVENMFVKHWLYYSLMLYGCFHPASVVSNSFRLIFLIMLLNTKLASIVTRQSVWFPPTQQFEQQPAIHTSCFPEWRQSSSAKSNIFGVLLRYLIRLVITLETSGITLLSSKQAQRHFCSVQKQNLKYWFVTMCVSQLWCGMYIQCSIKLPRVACSNAYRIFRYIFRNVSVRPNHVTCFVRTSDALIRTHLLWRPQKLIHFMLKFQLNPPEENKDKNMRSADFCWLTVYISAYHGVSFWRNVVT